MGLIRWIKGLFKKEPETHHGEEYTPHHDFVLEDMTRNIYTDQEIADRLGRTKRSVQQRRYILNKNDE